MDLNMDDLKGIPSCCDGHQPKEEKQITGRSGSVIVNFENVEPNMNSNLVQSQVIFSTPKSEIEDCPHDCPENSELQFESDIVKILGNGDMKNGSCCKCKKNTSLTQPPRNWEAFDLLFQIRMKIFIGLIIYFFLWLMIHFMFIL